MEKVRGDFQTLYQRENPHLTGLTLSTHVNPVEVSNKVTLDTEVEAAVQGLRLHRVGGHIHLCAEHFKQWRREAYPGKIQRPPAEGMLGVPGRTSTAHVAYGGDLPGVGMENPGTDSKGDNQHKRNWPAGDTVEGGGGADQHSTPRQATDA